jgi:hypothetical protein
MDSASQSNVRVESEPLLAASGDNTFCGDRTFNTAAKPATAGDVDPHWRALIRRSHHPMATGEGHSR